MKLPTQTEHSQWYRVLRPFRLRGQLHSIGQVVSLKEYEAAHLILDFVVTYVGSGEAPPQETP